MVQRYVPEQDSRKDEPEPSSLPEHATTESGKPMSSAKGRKASF